MGVNKDLQCASLLTSKGIPKMSSKAFAHRTMRHHFKYQPQRQIHFEVQLLQFLDNIRIDRNIV